MTYRRHLRPLSTADETAYLQRISEATTDQDLRELGDQLIACYAEDKTLRELLQLIGLKRLRAVPDELQSPRTRGKAPGAESRPTER